MKSYIPTINISSLLKSEFETKSAINTLKKIEKACVEVGFFQIIGHVINIKKIDLLSFLIILNLNFLIVKLKRIKKGSRIPTCLRINFNG